MALPAILGSVKRGAGNAIKSKVSSNLFDAVGGNKIPALKGLFGALQKSAKSSTESNSRISSKEATEKKKDRQEDVAEAHAKAQAQGIAKQQDGTQKVFQKIAKDVADVKEILEDQSVKMGENKNGAAGTGGIVGALKSVVAGGLSWVGSAILGKLAAGPLGKLLSGGKGLIGKGIGAVVGAAGGLGRSVLGMGKAALAGSGVMAAGKAAMGMADDGLAKGAVEAAKGSAGKVSGGLIKAGAESGAAIASKGVAKAAGKSLAKKIPLGVGALVGAGLAAHRAFNGDFEGAGLELASGVAAILPGVGTAASVAIDVALAKRDYDREVANEEAIATIEENLPTLPTGEVSPSEPSLRPVSATNVSSGLMAQPAVFAEPRKSSGMETLFDIMSTMLGLMSNKEQGIYVKPADNPLEASPRFMNVSGESKPSTAPTRERGSEPTRDYPELPRPASRVPTTGGSMGSPSQTDMARGLYDAAIKAGYSPEGANVIIGEIGRENSLNPDLVFGSHDDPANNKRNAGIISFQGDRKDALQKHLSETPGALNADGSFARNQTNLDAQLAFLRKEMAQRGEHDLLGKLSSNNIDKEKVAEQLGRETIRWRIDDPKYRDDGLANARSFRNIADKAVNSGSIAPSGPPMPSVSPQGTLMAQTQDAIDKGVKYGFGEKNTKFGKIDCSGWIAQINKNLIGSISDQGADVTSSKKAEKLFEGGASHIVENIARVTGKVMDNSELTAESLKEGMIIGEDNGKTAWDSGRYKGIDHITQVVKDPETGKMMISQSSGGKGVNLTPAEEYLSSKNAKGTKLYGVDTASALDQVTSGAWGEMSKRISQPVPQIAAAMQESSAELSAVDNAGQPIIIAPQTQSSGGGGGSGGGSSPGLTAPMVTRSSDSSISRLTDNYMGHSMSIA